MLSTYSSDAQITYGLILNYSLKGILSTPEANSRREHCCSGGRAALPVPVPRRPGVGDAPAPRSGRARGRRGGVGHLGRRVDVQVQPRVVVVGGVGDGNARFATLDPLVDV